MNNDVNGRVLIATTAKHEFRVRDVISDKFKVEFAVLCAFRMQNFFRLTRVIEHGNKCCSLQITAFLRENIEQITWLT